MAVYRAGQKAPESGIYRCKSFFCSETRTVQRGKKLPPCRKGHKEWLLYSQTTKSKSRG
jgi:hypothetical protein